MRLKIQAADGRTVRRGSIAARFTTMRILCVALILLSCLSSVAGQTPADSTTRRSDQDQNRELLRLRGDLDRLALEARTLQDQDSRPDAVIAVADTYWELDQHKARDLFLTALDLALAIEGSSKERDSTVRRVLASAASRDPELTKRLIDRLQTAQDRDSRIEPIGAAIDLLQIDRKAAEAVALASSHLGPSLDSAWLIFELQKQDPAAADRVYLAYLNNVSRGMPNQLLWLAGYPFGYVEAFGGSIDPLQFTGMFGIRSSTLTANPALAKSFLEVATEVINRSFRESTGIPPEQAEALNGLVFFVATYLSPQIGRYRPDLKSRWLVLQESASAGISMNRRQEILSKVNNIFAARREHEKTGEGSTSIETLLAEAEKLSTTCQKDSAYARALFQLSYKKDFRRAISVADKIDSLDLRNQALQFIYYDMAVAALSTKPAANLDEALRNTERLTLPEQRALLYMRMAQVARGNEDRDRAFTFLLDAGRLAERIAEPTARAGLLFSAAYELADLDSSLSEPIRMMRNAIQVVNDTKNIKMDRITVLRRVDLGCNKQGGEWYGSAGPLARFDLLETLAKIASSDLATAQELVNYLAEGPNRIRARAAITRVELMAYRETRN